MSNVIIVENLGKKYTLHHQQREQYTALRDVITRGVAAIGQSLIRPFRTLPPLNTSDPVSQEEFWALKDVSFEVKQGDRLGIIGRNGAGKSTLLKILSRITEPTTGSVRIKGRVASLLEVGTGFHPELTGRENIFLNGAILGMSRLEIARKFDEIVAFAEIERFLDTPVKRYSSGMYVRLAFAVAAHLEPEILIVDEVLAVGDVLFQKKCLGRMEEIGREGRTVLFVSHNMAAINNLCSSAIWLNNGSFSGYGRTDEIIRNYLMATGTQGVDIHHQPPEFARVALKRVWVVSCGGNISSTMDVTKPFEIHIKFDVREKVSDIDVGIWIRNMRDVPVCFTSLSEANGGELLLLEPGSYVCSFQVPALFFVPDGYRLMVKAHVPNLTTEDQISDAGEFSLVETGTVQGRYSQSWKHGVVLGRFDWKISREKK